MPLVMPQEGRTLMLNRLFGKAATGDLTLKLFQNNYTPVDTSNNAAFTEATFPGYAAITLLNANVTVTPATDNSSAAAPQQTFTATGAGTSVYGYYVVSGTTVVFAERFTDGPYAISNSGDNVKVTMNFNTARQ
jgi:hypothetical protein